MFVALAGGIGAARYLRGLVRVVAPSDITVIANVGDDIELHGLHVSPDIDTVVYTLAGVVHPEQGWGRRDETFHIAEELARVGEPTWFRLGDRDLATHIVRTARLRAGATLSEVTAELVTAFGLELRILPATDDPVATRIATADGRELHFQEYWVREHGAPPVVGVRLDGADAARPAPGLIDAILGAEAVLICPSNPVVSIGTILAVPGIVDALTETGAPVVGVSPIVGGAVVRGMADRLLPAVGAAVSAAGVAAMYRTWLDGWVIDRRDLDAAGEIEAMGIAVAVTDTVMDTIETSEAVARTALALAGRIRGPGWVADPLDPSGGTGPTPGEAKRRARAVA